MPDPLTTPAAIGGAGATPSKKLAANLEWKRRNKERVRELTRARNAAIFSDPEKREKRKRDNREWRQLNAQRRMAYDSARDKEKIHARNQVRHAIAIGRIKRLPCERCGDQNSHAHHNDYAKPLDVKWLCHKHHGEEHAKY